MFCLSTDAEEEEEEEVVEDEVREGHEIFLGHSIDLELVGLKHDFSKDDSSGAVGKTCLSCDVIKWTDLSDHSSQKSFHCLWHNKLHKPVLHKAVE